MDIKRILSQKAVNKADDVPENENLNINYDWPQICGKLQTNRNSYLNTRNITTDYTIMLIYTDFIKATKTEENLMDIIQNLDIGDIYELDQLLNFMIEISLSLNMQFYHQNNNKYVPLSERGYPDEIGEGIFSIKKEKKSSVLRTAPLQRSKIYKTFKILR